MASALNIMIPIRIFFGRILKNQANLLPISNKFKFEHKYFISNRKIYSKIPYNYNFLSILFYSGLNQVLIFDSI